MAEQENRPTHCYTGAASEPERDQASSTDSISQRCLTCGNPTPQLIYDAGTFDQCADLVLRCAWLRFVGHEKFAVDISGVLSAQLLDMADLLEVTERQGWFE
jgi:hypothetical protein